MLMKLPQCIISSFEAVQCSSQMGSADAIEECIRPADCGRIVHPFGGFLKRMVPENGKLAGKPRHLKEAPLH